MSRTLRLLLASAVVLSTGCAVAPKPVESVTKTEGFQGHVRGGQQPVSGSTIQLYAVGTTGDGSSATPLLSKAVTSDAGGNFNFSGLYTCPTPATLVYLTASGGNPGLGAGLSNPNFVLVAALGRCDALTPSTFILVDEVTTVAAVSALAPFMTSASAVGSSSSDLAALQDAFTMASYFASTITGTSPGLNVPAGDTVPTAMINTLADVISACVNSAGGKAGDGSLCGQLFTLTKLPGSPAPGDTVSALLDIAIYPSLNTASLYSMVPASPPYQPMLPSAPSDFAVRLLQPPLLQITPAGGLTFESAAAVASTSQTVTLTNVGGTQLNLGDIAFLGANADDFAETNNCPASLPSSAQCNVNVVFTPSAAGERTAYLQITSSDPNSPQAIPLSGSVTPAGELTITPSQLTFLDTSVGFTSQPQTITLQNKSNSQIFLSISITGANQTDFLFMGGCPFILSPGAVCTTTVSAQPSALGLRTNSYTFTSTAANSPQTVSVSVTGVAPSNGPAELSASSLSWTIAGVTQDILLENFGNTPLAVGNISIVGGYYDFTATSNCGVSLLAQSSCIISVTSNRIGSDSNEQPLSYSGTLTVPVDTPGGSVTASLASTNTSGVQIVGSSGNFLDFPAAATGATSTASFYVAPASHTTYVAFSGTISGTDAGDFSPTSAGCSETVMGYAQGCSVTLSFTPTAPGVRSARLVTSSGYIPLTGKSGAFFTAPSPFAVYPVIFNGPASASEPLTINNTGSTTLQFTSFPFSGANASLFSAADTSGACASIAPGASCAITVSYTSGSKAPFTTTLTLTDNVSGTTQAIAVTGQAVDERFQTSTNGIQNFSAVVGTTSAPQSFTITGPNGRPYEHELAIYLSNSFGTAQDFSITSGSTCPASSTQICTVSVVFQPQGLRGGENCYLMIVDKVTGQVGQVDLYGIAQGVPALSLSPSSINFPQRPVNTISVPTSVTVSNTGTASVTISSINIIGANPADFSQTNTCTAPLAAGQSCSISVFYSPVETGSQSAKIQIVSNAPTSPDTITLSGSAD